MKPYGARISKLWNATKLAAGSHMRKYSDDEWCEGYPADKYFAFVITWGPLKEAGRKIIWKRVSRAIGNRKLSEIDPKEVKFGLDWQNKFFRNLVRYLKSKHMSASDFVAVLRTKNSREAKSFLKDIVQSHSDKIVECWLRDIARVDAFPIDSNVRRVLKRYHVPDDSDLIVKCAQSLNIPVREFARAVYGEADRLLTS
jgi:hypothetical protein